MGSPTELAWAAGFFDGEGSISAIHDKRPGRRPSISLSIEQVDLRPLTRFREAVNWHGNIVQRPARRAPNRRPINRIYTTNEAALNIIGVLWPWLSEPKREQFERALAIVGEDRYVTPQVA